MTEHEQGPWSDDVLGDLTARLVVQHNIRFEASAAIFDALEMIRDAWAADRAALVADNKQLESDWLAMCKEIAAAANDTDAEWDLADDATLMEEFDPWQAVRELGQMVAERDALQQRVVELEGERNYLAVQLSELKDVLLVQDETRSICSAAWDEINNEVERINEADRLARLEDNDGDEYLKGTNGYE